MSKKWNKIKWLPVAVGCLTVLLLFTASCITFRVSDKKMLRTMNKDHIRFDIVNETYGEENFRYLRYKHPGNVTGSIVFIHGAPGSSSAFLDYIRDSTLRARYNMYVIDRPGYGYSAYGKYVPLADQLKQTKAFIENLDEREEVIAVGHSYGGTIAGLLAAMPPDRLKGTIMISPAIDPDHEKFTGLGKLGFFPIIRPFISGALRVSSFEKTTHISDLQKALPLWSKISLPVLHIHGTADNLVPYENTAFSKKEIPEKYLKMITLEGKNHLIPFTMPHRISEYIISFADSVVVAK